MLIEHKENLIPQRLKARHGLVFFVLCLTLFSMAGRMSLGLTPLWVKESQLDKLKREVFLPFPPFGYDPTVLTYEPQNPFNLKWPVRRARVTQLYRPKYNRKHEGIDVGGKNKEPIFSSHEGYVAFIGIGVRGYGNVVVIRYDNKWATIYAHLDDFVVKERQIVQQGDIIGYMGKTGRSTGVHLHFELLWKGRPIDPVPHFKHQVPVSGKPIGVTQNFLSDQL